MSRAALEGTFPGHGSTVRRAVLCVALGLLLTIGTALVLAAVPVTVPPFVKGVTGDRINSFGVRWPHAVPSSWPIVAQERLEFGSVGRRFEWTWAPGPMFNHVARSDAFGWPFLALRTKDAALYPNPSMPMPANILSMSMSPSVRANALAAGRSRIPTTPTWGLLADTLLAAIAMFLVWEAWIRVVRLRSWRRGITCWCGYDLHASRSDRCPECGRRRR